MKAADAPKEEPKDAPAKEEPKKEEAKADDAKPVETVPTEPATPDKEKDKQDSGFEVLDTSLQGEHKKGAPSEVKADHIADATPTKAEDASPKKRP